MWLHKVRDHSLWNCYKHLLYSNVITYAYICRAFLVTCYLVVCMCILYNFFVVFTHIFFYEEGSKEMLETLAYLFFQSDVCVCRKQDTGVSNIKIFTEKLDSQFRPMHVCNLPSAYCICTGFKQFDLCSLVKDWILLALGRK